METNNKSQTSCNQVQSPVKPYRGPLGQIRKHCIDCADGPKSVRYCGAVDCPLWPYRFGKHPRRVMREEGEGSAHLFDREWILEEAKHGSDA